MCAGDKDVCGEGKGACVSVSMACWLLYVACGWIRCVRLSTSFDDTVHMYAPSAPTPAETSMACPKCGTVEKTGKLSCCAPSGAWFKNCGDDDDSRFDHTWTEGIRACKKSK